MLYRIFSSNRPIVFALLLPVAVALAILAGIYSAPPTHLMGGLLFKHISSLFGGSKIFLLTTGTLVNLSSALLLNRLSNSHDYAEKENYFVGLIYFIFCSLQLSWFYLNPVSLAVLFLLLALRRLLKIYRIQHVTSNLYDAGLFLALVFMIFPPLAPAILLVWFSLAQLRTFNLREWVVPLFGIATPIVYAVVYYWWFDYSPDLYRFVDLSRLSFGEMADADSFVDYSFIVLSLGMAFIGLSKFFREMTASTVHKKNTKAVFLWLSLLVAISYVIASSMLVDQAGTTMLWASSSAIFISVFLVITKRPLLVNIAFYTWIIFGVLVLVFNSIQM